MKNSLQVTDTTVRSVRMKKTGPEINEAGIGSISLYSD